MADSASVPLAEIPPVPEGETPPGSQSSPAVQFVSPDAAPVIALQKCGGTVGTYERGRDEVSSQIGPAFDVLGAHPSTASLVFEALECRRSVVASEVFENVTVVQVWARVQPRAAEWANYSQSMYVLAFLTGPSNFTAALTEFGLPAQNTTVIEREWAQVETTRGATWRFQTERGVLEFERWEAGGSAGGGDSLVHYWIPAPDGFRRLDVEKQYRYDEFPVLGGILREFEDSSGGPTSSAVTLVPWTGQSYAGDAETWTVGTAIFAGQGPTERTVPP